VCGCGKGKTRTSGPDFLGDLVRGENPGALRAPFPPKRTRTVTVSSKISVLSSIALSALNLLKTSSIIFRSSRYVPISETGFPAGIKKIRLSTGAHQENQEYFLQQAVRKKRNEKPCDIQDYRHPANPLSFSSICRSCSAFFCFVFSMKSRISGNDLTSS